MAMVPTITQAAPAQMGGATPFTVTITNTGGAQVSILAMQPTVRKQTLHHATPATVPPIFIPPSMGVAQGIGGSQYSIPVGPGASVSFGFSISLFGPVVAGGATQPPMVFVVDVQCTFSDGTSSGCSNPLTVGLNAPQFGQPPGVPQNPAAVIGQLDFQVPGNSALML